MKVSCNPDCLPSGTSDDRWWERLAKGLYHELLDTWISYKIYSTSWTHIPISKHFEDSSIVRKCSVLRTFGKAAPTLKRLCFALCPRQANYFSTYNSIFILATESSYPPAVGTWVARHVQGTKVSHSILEIFTIEKWRPSHASHCTYYVSSRR